MSRPLMVPPWLRERLEELLPQLRKAFDESRVRRHPKGTSEGGRFMAQEGGTTATTWDDLNVKRREGNASYEAQVAQLRATVEHMSGPQERKEALLRPLLAAAIHRATKNMSRDDLGLPRGLRPVGDFPSGSPHVTVLIENGMTIADIDERLRVAQVEAMAAGSNERNRALASIEQNGRVGEVKGTAPADWRRSASSGPPIPDVVEWGSAVDGRERVAASATGKVANTRVYHRDVAAFATFAQRRPALRFGFIRETRHLGEGGPPPGMYWEIQFYGPGARRQAAKWTEATGERIGTAVY